MRQLQIVGTALTALSVMVQASSINAVDTTKLTALAQTWQTFDDEGDMWTLRARPLRTGLRVESLSRCESTPGRGDFRVN